PATTRTSRPRPRSAPSWTPGPATRHSSKRGGALSNAGRTLRPRRSDLAEKRAPRLGELCPLPSVGGEDLIAAPGGLPLSHPSRMLRMHVRSHGLGGLRAAPVERIVRTPVRICVGEEQRDREEDTR